MKKCILTLLATLICLFLFALDITSTAEGGNRLWALQLPGTEASSPVQMIMCLSMATCCWIGIVHAAI